MLISGIVTPGSFSVIPLKASSTLLLVNRIISLPSVELAYVSAAMEQYASGIT